MSLRRGLPGIERGIFLGNGTMEVHFTEAAPEGRQLAPACDDPSHGASCAFSVQPSTLPGRFVRIVVGVGLPG